MEKRRIDLEKVDEQRSSAISDGDLPTSVAEKFAMCIESILKTWHFLKDLAFPGRG